MQKILNILLIGLILLTSCEDQNYLHDKYLAEGEIIYDGSVNSLKAFPGIGRVKLKWINTYDAKVTKCNISWNNGENNLMVNISDVLVDTATNTCEVSLENLDEGYYTFELVNEDPFGHKSLPLSIQTEVLGNQVISGSSNLILASANSIGANTYVMSISPKPDVYWVKFNYENTSGGNTTICQPITIGGMNTFTIKEAKTGGNYSYKSQYFLEGSIDSFYTVTPKSGTLPPLATSVKVSSIANLGNHQVSISFTPKLYSKGVNLTYAKMGGGTITKYITVTDDSSSDILDEVEYDGEFSYVTEYGYNDDSYTLDEQITSTLPGQYYIINKSGWKHVELFYDIPGDCWGGSIPRLWDGKTDKQFDFHTGCDDKNSLPCLITIDIAKPTLIKEIILTSTGVDWNPFPTRVQLWGIKNLLNAEVEVPSNDPDWQTYAESMDKYKLIIDAEITGTWNTNSDYSIPIPDNTETYQYVRLRIFSSTNYTTLNEITFKGIVP